MQIRWAPNPLKTIVELDEADKLLLREKLKTEELEENLCRVSLAKTLEEARQAADFEYICGDKDYGGKSFEVRLDERLAYYITDMLGEHDGDCVCVACSCGKCHAERLLGINTIRGLGKHEATKIGWAFMGDAGERTIDEAIERLRNYRPEYKFIPNWPEEEWRKHVPRWIEEARRALTWLEAYRAIHFMTNG